MMITRGFGEVGTMHDTLNLIVLFADVPGLIPGITTFFVSSEKCKMSDDDIILEEDAADSGAKSYIWNYFADIRGHGEKGCSKNLLCKF
jgi:hypothetical protein